MRTCSLIACLLTVIYCYAYEIETQALTEESLQLEDKSDIRLPAISKASPGKVTRRTLQLLNFPYSIFVIGSDDFSYQWLKQHAKALEKQQALGFVANIEKSADLEALQALIKAPLLPANVDDLLALFHEKHYPLMFHKGEIWQ